MNSLKTVSTDVLGSFSAVAAIATTALLGTPIAAESAILGSEIDLKPLIAVGNPDASPSDSPANRIDPNTLSSPFTGVGGIALFSPDRGTFICTGTPITRTHILSAGHCLDALDGDGSIDFSPEDVAFVLNYGSDLSHVIAASQLDIHPGFEGFENSIANDLALITLSSELPESVPIYPLHPNPLRPGDLLVFAGYGMTGTGTDGFQTDASFKVKRVGANLVEEASVLSPLFPGIEEMFLFDFDDPFGTPTPLDAANRLLGLPTTLSLGNEIEATLGPGDSGGPSFVFDGESLFLAGVNTFGLGFPDLLGVPGTGQGFFGSGAGGVRIDSPNKRSWIETVIGSTTRGEGGGKITESLLMRNLIAKGFGQEEGGGNSTGVPEPHSILGLCAIALVFSQKRRRHS
ncbi:trypsin-like serine protease [Lusitaniella coriacea LEGE 07157]|uniref:Trypsin-like serine protease n=1 Tax=Lusitaniella coriacea LEGE 07157 TaxID=945747 RepID=A0A8J7E042_9CYAN|nr:trypsin-like serine protease [Lusitaniella coriacea]MBE9118598.1 trypsin-like serine protease [Lusitaniella coriacea LEGE 07157]